MMHFSRTRLSEHRNSHSNSYRPRINRHTALISTMTLGLVFTPTTISIDSQAQGFTPGNQPAQEDPQKVHTPGWAQQLKQVEQALKNAEDKQQLIVVLRTADQYKTASYRQVVQTWAQMPAWKKVTRVRVPTTGSHHLTKALKAQATGFETKSPDLWLITPDLQLLAYVPYPSGKTDKAIEATGPAIQQAQSLMKSYKQFASKLQFANRQSAQGRIGTAWQSVLSVCQQDAKLHQKMFPKQASDSDETSPQTPRLADQAKQDQTASNKRGVMTGANQTKGYENPGPGFFYDNLFETTLTEYRAIAQRRLKEAEALLDEDPTQAKRLLAPLLIKPMRIQEVQEARLMMQLANQTNQANKEKAPPPPPPSPSPSPSPEN